MINNALMPRDIFQLNEFTAALFSRILKQGSAKVLLRNNLEVIVKSKQENNLDGDFIVFYASHSDGSTSEWYPDGSHITGAGARRLEPWDIVELQ